MKKCIIWIAVYIIRIMNMNKAVTNEIPLSNPNKQWPYIASLGLGMYAEPSEQGLY